MLRRFAPGPQPWSPGHRGVDLGAGAGAAVLAAGDGRVTFVGTVAGVGVVVVDHGTLRTTYGPVTATMPSGAAVSAGQEIGRLDAATGHCGRACLHWGALRGSVYVDPLLLPGLPGAPGPPVLLPLGVGQLTRAVAGPAGAAVSSGSASLPRSCSTALVCIWQIRLSVTPRTWPISASVRPS